MTRACGRADRMVIYVPVHATHALRRALRHAQFAYTEGERSVKKTERETSVCVCVCARKSEWKRIYATRRKVREGESGREGRKGRGLRRGGGGGGGGGQGQERRDKERTDETTGAGEKEITAGSDRVVEINVARLIGATEECACGLSGSQLATLRRHSYVSLGHVPTMTSATFDI